MFVFYIIEYDDLKLCVFWLFSIVFEWVKLFGVGCGSMKVYVCINFV